MPARRGHANPRDPRRRSEATYDEYDASEFDDDRGFVPSTGHSSAHGARGRGRPRMPDGDEPFEPRLTLPSVPRMGGQGDSRRATTARMPAYVDQVPLREPSVLVPGKDSGKFASTRRIGRAPSVGEYDRARLRGARQDDAADDWDAAEAWQASHGWDELEHAQTQRALAPALARYQRQVAPMRRVGAATHALAKRARSRWWTMRYLLAVIAAVAALFTTFTAAGQPADAHPGFQASASSKRLEIVAQEVRPLTSLLHPEQYDSTAQFNLYGGAACSPSVLAEVLTAWGVPHATIGQMIDDLGSYLSPYDGLLDQQGFEAAAAKHNMRADISWHLTYDQILYLTNVLGIPVIVNFRRDYGYYHYFAGGHFLVVTGGDENGLTIVDSSEYFIKYLPHDVFDGLWQWRGDGTAMTVVVVPQAYQYTLPTT
jgi:hypothetical protein